MKAVFTLVGKIELSLLAGTRLPNVCEPWIRGTCQISA